MQDIRIAIMDYCQITLFNKIKLGSENITGGKLLAMYTAMATSSLIQILSPIMGPLGTARGHS